MIWIYALEDDPRFGASAQDLLRGIREAGHTLLASYFSLAELLVHPERDGNVFLADAYRKTLRSREIEMLSFTERTAQAFARIRVVSKVSPPDAVHVALAASGRTDLFVTQDARLLRTSVDGIGRIVDLNFALR